MYTLYLHCCYLPLFYSSTSPHMEDCFLQLVIVIRNGLLGEITINLLNMQTLVSCI